MGLSAIGSQQQSIAQLPEGRDSDSSLSAAEEYRQLKEAIERSLGEKGIDRLTFVGDRRPSKEPGAIFQEKSNKTARYIFTAVFSGAVALGIFTVGKPSASSGVRYRGPATEESPSSNQTLIVRAGGIIIAGGGSLFSITSYQKLGEELRKDISREYNNIAADEVDRGALQESVDRVFEKKKGSWFNRIFEYLNPIPTAYLLLTQGIVLDSGRYYDNAQKQYQMALQHNINPELQNIIRFALARSFRLSGKTREASGQIGLIPVNSPVHVIGQIESEALQARNANEVFDPHDDNIPFKFKCPITHEMISEPAYYTFNNGRRCYFEDSAIRAWINRGGRCLFTQQPMQLQQLTPDDNFASAIQIWNQTKLKQA